MINVLKINCGLLPYLPRLVYQFAFFHGGDMYINAVENFGPCELNRRIFKTGQCYMTTYSQIISGL